MTAFWFSLVVLLVCFGVYLAVGFLRSVSRETEELDIEWIDSDVLEREGVDEEVWVYDAALAAPKLVSRVIDYTEVDLVRLKQTTGIEPYVETYVETHEPAPSPGPAGVYNVVYWSDDRTHRREKQLFADNPHQARQLADQHEAEYVRETGAAPYSFSRIDHPEEQQAD